ncbi:MAG: haloalkane dehalogenase [Rhodobacter sp.]|nr:haloalkane dehalogenase [Rhodobacter sp.]
MNRRELLISTAAAAAVSLPPPAWAMGSADFPFAKKTMTVLGHKMAYVDQGDGAPVVFLHGNPTSSYLWRNILPEIAEGYRVIAPDIIGMGDSAKPAIGYTYPEHAAHLHGLLDALDLEDVTLVIHDWGSALGLDWAERNRDRVRAVAFMEAILPPGMPVPSYAAMGPFGEMFRAWRTPGIGERLILEENVFIDEVLGKLAVARPLAPEVLAAYNSHYPDAASRAPLLQWPREIPIGGEPAHSVEVVERYSAWFLDSDLPKLMIHAEPGALIPPEAAAWLKGRMTNLTSVNIGAGVHFLQEDNPLAVTRALSAWIDTL